jgi:hypothetical protein
MVAQSSSIIIIIAETARLGQVALEAAPTRLRALLEILPGLGHMHVLRAKRATIVLLLNWATKSSARRGRTAVRPQLHARSVQLDLIVPAPLARVGEWRALVGPLPLVAQVCALSVQWDSPVQTLRALS